jgi:hypothetical protein
MPRGWPPYKNTWSSLGTSLFIGAAARESFAASRRPLGAEDTAQPGARLEDEITTRHFCSELRPVVTTTPIKHMPPQPMPLR